MKFISSSTYKKLGFSYVTILEKGKYYTGRAKLHSEDSKNWSEYTGCRYAETRAMIQALKYERKKKKAACEECRKFVKAVSQYKNFDKNSSTAKAMYRQLNRRIKEINKITDQINKMELELRITIRNQDSINKKANKKD